VKPADFEYHRPDGLGEALALLQQLGDEAKLLAGGQSLVPMMNLRLITPAALVDLNRIDALAGIRLEDGTVTVGAMTRQWDLETSELAAECCPLLREALVHVGHVPTRTRGTIGGSLAHADASAELPIVAVALGAELVVASGQPDDQRVVAADDFFQYYFTTTLEPVDVLVEVRFPCSLRPACGSNWTRTAAAATPASRLAGSPRPPPAPAARKRSSPDAR
jgi:CO/xanthine dehydrogenase FAD-binding subunit